MLVDNLQYHVTPHHFESRQEADRTCRPSFGTAPPRTNRAWIKWTLRHLISDGKISKEIPFCGALGHCMPLSRWRVDCSEGSDFGKAPGGSRGRNTPESPSYQFRSVERGNSPQITPLVKEKSQPSLRLPIPKPLEPYILSPCFSPLAGYATTYRTSWRRVGT